MEVVGIFVMLNYMTLNGWNALFSAIGLYWAHRAVVQDIYAAQGMDELMRNLYFLTVGLNIMHRGPLLFPAKFLFIGKQINVG